MIMPRERPECQCDHTVSYPLAFSGAACSTKGRTAASVSCPKSAGAMMRNAHATRYVVLSCVLLLSVKVIGTQVRGVTPMLAQPERPRKLHVEHVLVYHKPG